MLVVVCYRDVIKQEHVFLSKANLLIRLNRHFRDDKRAYKVFKELFSKLVYRGFNSIRSQRALMKSLSV